MEYKKRWSEEFLKEVAKYPSEKVDKIDNPLLVQFLIKRRVSESVEDYNIKCSGIIEYLQCNAKNTILDSLTPSEKTKVESLRELIKRVSGFNGKKVAILTPKDVFRLLNHNAYFAEQESLWAIYVNGAHEVIDVQEVTKGIANRTIAHPREIFKDAVKLNAVAVCIAHNHPTGHTEPSNDDREITKRISKAGEILGIPLLDHVVFSADSYYSFAEHNAI